MVIFPSREVLESASTSSPADLFTVRSEKPEDQPALCPLAAGVAVGAGAPEEAE